MITVPDYLLASSNRSMCNSDGKRLEYILTDKKCSCEMMLETNMFLFVIKGRKEIITPIGHRILLEPGQGIFLTKGNYILARSLINNHKDSEQDENLRIHLTDTFISDFLIQYSELFKKYHVLDKRLENLYYFPLNRAIEATINSIFPLFHTENEHLETLLDLKCSDLLINLILSEDSGSFSALLKECVTNSDLISFMTENYTRPLSVEQFASEMNMSLSAFKKEFKNQLNSSPKKWINKNRLKRAKTLLRHTSMSVSEIGFIIGFSGISYFITLFKKEFDITPKQYQITMTEKIVPNVTKDKRVNS